MATVVVNNHDNNRYCSIMQWRIQDFPEEGAPTLQGGRQHTILPNFPENCMKLKEFGPPGGRTSKILLCRSATVMGCWYQIFILSFHCVKFSFTFSETFE